MTHSSETLDDQLAQSRARQIELEARLAALPPSASAARTLTESMLASEQQLQQRLSELQASSRRRRPNGFSRPPVTWRALAVIGAVAAAGWIVRSWRRR